MMLLYNDQNGKTDQLLSQLRVDKCWYFVYMCMFVHTRMFVYTRVRHTHVESVVIPHKPSTLLLLVCLR